MPIVKNIPLITKMHAISLIETGKATLRSAAVAVDIAKSTLHDNIPKFKQEVNEFVNWQKASEERLVRNTLSMMMEGKNSARSAAVVLSRIERRHVDHNKVLEILNTASEIAKKKNLKKLPLHSVGEGSELLPPLSKVQGAGFDEIFQGKDPILSFVDPISSYCHLEAADNRKAETWEKMLIKLKMLGLNTLSNVTDGGSGLLKALRKVSPNSINIRDFFHVVDKIERGLNALARHCYKLIEGVDKLVGRKNPDEDKIEKLLVKMDRSIALFDAFEKEYKRFRAACYCENDGKWVGSNDIKVLIQRVTAIIDCIEREGIHRKYIKNARSYLNGSVTEILAYKTIIESEVKKRFGDIGSLSVLDSICPMIEYLDQIQRSYEDNKRKSYWTKKLVEAKAAFRGYDFINQDELDTAINEVAKIMLATRKSNSLVETINSVIRRHLVAYKSIPKWFCPLFVFYWNNRRFTRGKRKGLKPKEILTGKHFEGDWIDLIIEDWPKEKLKTPEKNQELKLAS